jgi:hypothetical protein
MVAWSVGPACCCVWRAMVEGSAAGSHSCEQTGRKSAKPRMKSTIAALAALAAMASPAWAFSSAAAHQLGQLDRVTAVRAPQRSVGALQMSDGRHHKGAPVVKRRVALALAALPVFGLRKASAASLTEAEELSRLKAEAARIQEIFDIQKELNSDLPTLKKSVKAVAAKDAPAPGSDSVDAKNLVAVIDTMMRSLEQEGEGGMRTVLAYSTPSNPIKNMPFKNVINAMKDSSYALLFGKFTAYEIKKPAEPAMVDDERRTSVDVVVKAPYNVMVQNGVQFNEMVMPKEEDKERVCSVTFRWNMRQEQDGSWESDGCYIVA